MDNTSLGIYVSNTCSHANTQKATICEKEFAENLSDSTETFVCFSGHVQHLVIWLEAVIFCLCLEAFGTGIAGLTSFSCTLAIHTIEIVNGYCAGLWRRQGQSYLQHECVFYHRMLFHWRNSQQLVESGEPKSDVMPPIQFLL